MRRRSERKKSTDVSSPAPTAASRRTSSRRSRKSPSQSETERNVETIEGARELDAEEEDRDSSEERAEATNRKSRSTRNRTPVKDRCSPSKRRNQRAVSEQKIDVIPEEENGAVDSNEVGSKLKKDVAKEEVEYDGTHTTSEVTTPSPTLSPKAKDDNNLKVLDVADQEEEEPKQDKEEKVNIPGLNEVNTSGEGNTLPVNKEPESAGDAEERKSNEGREQVAKELNTEQDDEPKPNNEHDDKEKTAVKDSEAKLTEDVVDETVNETSGTIKQQTRAKSPVFKNEIIANVADNSRIRKRKWLTKKGTEAANKAPILSISTDSLKNLIADVHPVPLSDIQLESSSEVEEVVSEREEGEETPSPERERRRPSITIEKIEKTITTKRQQNDEILVVPATELRRQIVQRSPSPARNNASQVLFITNLVRPFTVLQLKGLLARTGKIVDEDGFWIDRIKSKCYVHYETEDEATETRHALHGVRWPVSNPKCLNVDFGSKSDMERAINSTKEDAPKFGQDNKRENFIEGSGSSWTRDRNEEDIKSTRPVREWDVGKKESLDRDKSRDLEKRRSRERATSGNRENDKIDKDRKNRSKGREQRSSSLSPVRKLKKKENDPPLRLLDDLFRKTKATPCIYWLPLTPEQIAEKEAFRQKRIEEHKERIKQRELERGKEREKEKSRRSSKSRDRDRRNRSSDRRRSRSQNRRRY